MSRNSPTTAYLLIFSAVVLLASAGCTNEKTIRTNNAKQGQNQKPNNNNNKKPAGNKKPATFDVALFATSNPTGSGSDYIVGIDSKLDNAANLYQLKDIGSIQSLAFDDDGDALVTYDAQNNSDGGVKKFSGVPDKSNQKPAISPRTADGSDAPKGLLWVKDVGGDELQFDTLFVADVGDSNDDGSIRVYDVDSGTPRLAFTVTNLGESGKKIWDMAYDRDNDRLYVTRTDGILLLYTQFMQQASVNPNNVTVFQITPVDDNGNKVSINLHGIVYDPGNDRMVLSDVGDATNPNDGKIFVIDDFFDDLDGQGGGDINSEVTGMLSGDKTKLGNPVDIVVKGDDLFVAEKSNDLVMRFDDIFDLDQQRNDAADDSIKVVKPESLALKP